MKNLVITTLLLFSFLGFSQTISAPIDLSLNIELLSEKEIPEAILDTLTDPMSILTVSDTVLIAAAMEVADTVNLSKIHIKLGTTDGANDLSEYVFDFDNENPGGGLTYLREEENLTIGLGQYQYIGTFFCEIYFEDIQGNNSDIVKYQSN